MNSRVYTTTEILEVLHTPYYIFEYWVRSGKIHPVSEERGRGKERRFTELEFEKARNLARLSQLMKESDEPSPI